MINADLIGTLVGFILTLLIFSYLLGDNPLFRIAIHIFIGVSAGFAAVIAWNSVIWPQLFVPLLSGSQDERLLVLIPLVLGLLLFPKASPRLAPFGSISLAYLVGVGAATAIGGAVLGTLFPQVNVTANLLDRQNLAGNLGFLVTLVQNLVIFIGTLATLLYFHFSIRPQANQPEQRSPFMQTMANLGMLFIAVALGSLFAGVYAAALTAFVERWQAVGSFVLSLVQPN